MPLPLTLDRNSPEPLYRQIERQVRAAIETGRLRPGERLPSVRAVASDHEVGRLTVATAYETLAADGYVVGRTGFGTVVAPGAPRATEASRPRVEPARRGGHAAGYPVRRPVTDLSSVVPTRSSAASAAGLRFDLQKGGLGGPALNVGPALERLLREAWRDLADGGLGSAADPAGDPLLRAAIASHVRGARGARCEGSQVVVLSGAVIGIAAVARLWLTGGAPIAVEDPGDPAFRRALSLAGVPLRAAPIDRNGVRIETLPAAAVALVSPTVQSATGVAMPLARRLRLLGWAAEHGALVIEDARADDLALAAPSATSLAGLDEDGRVIHVAGFASLLHPGVQLGYAVVPADLVEPFSAAVSALDPGATPVQQRALGRFLADGHLDRHLARVRRALTDRHEAVLEAARRDLGWLVSTELPAGGTRAILTIEDESWTATDAAAAARSAGVGVEPLAGARLTAAPDRELVLDVGRHEPADLRRAIRMLAEALAGRGAPRASTRPPSAVPVTSRSIPPVGRPPVMRLDTAMRVGAGRSEPS